MTEERCVNAQRNLLKAMVDYTERKPDPRKHPRGRKPRRTDAGTGYAFFLHQDGNHQRYISADFNDKSMTKAQKKRFIALGLLKTEGATK